MEESVGSGDLCGTSVMISKNFESFSDIFMFYNLSAWGCGDYYYNLGLVLRSWFFSGQRHNQTMEREAAE
jgi:hypothetical protein